MKSYLLAGFLLFIFSLKVHGQFQPTANIPDVGYKIDDQKQFPNSLLDCLKINTDLLSASRLEQYVKERTAKIAFQTPSSAYIHEMDGFGGEFVFYPKQYLKEHPFNPEGSKAEDPQDPEPKGNPRTLNNKHKIGLTTLGLLAIIYFFSLKIFWVNRATTTKEITFEETVDFIEKEHSVSLSEFIEIEGGEFDMGCENHDSTDNTCVPLHKEYVANFRISDSEITNQQYCDFLNDSKPDSMTLSKWVDRLTRENGQEFEIRKLAKGKNLYQVENHSKKDHPVIFINWYGAKAYCDWLSLKMGYKFDIRLPTEVEWEYAAHGNKQINDSLLDLEGGGTLNKIRNSAPNEKGIYDMNANVSEWCYGINIGQDSIPVIRGGNWASSNKKELLPTYRQIFDPNSKNNNVGFRIVAISPLLKE